MEYLFYVIIALLITISCFQDFKRREIDNWLNLLIFLIGFFFIISLAITQHSQIIIYSFVTLLAINYGLSNLLYYGKVFAGGDAKLLLALTPLLTTFTIKLSLSNLLIFFCLLFISGASYGLISIVFLSIKERARIKMCFLENLHKKSTKGLLLGGLLLCLLGILDVLFLFLGLMLIIYPLLFIVAKALQEDAMNRKIKGKDLCEEDVLAEKVIFRGRTFIPQNKGLTKEEVKFLEKKKSVKIKDGIPFAPPFLIATILYLLFKLEIILFHPLF